MPIQIITRMICDIFSVNKFIKVAMKFQDILKYLSDSSLDSQHTKIKHLKILFLKIY